MIYFFTFCVDIDRHTKKELIDTLILLNNSLKKYHNEYELRVFSNFQINLLDKHIIFEDYFDNEKLINYDNRWYNLSYNKINIYKYLYDNHLKDYIWIDLDTIVVHELYYINNFQSYFIDTGGSSKDPHNLIQNDYTIVIPRNKWIQGNVWKLNINLYNKIIELNILFINKKKLFNYDLQSLFTYYFYFVLGGNYDTLKNNGIFISGRNCCLNVLNGLSIWHPNGNTHASKQGLENMFWKNNNLKSKYYSNKDIHIVSFTFITLKQLRNFNKFNEIIRKKIN